MVSYGFGGRDFFGKDDTDPTDFSGSLEEGLTGDEADELRKNLNKNLVDKRGPFQNVGQIGQAFSTHMLERLRTPVEQSQAFFHGSKAIRDALTGEAAETRQRLGDTAAAGGFLDSGAVIQGDLDIARGKSIAMAQAVNDLFLQLEDRRERDVLPFLAAFSGRQVDMRGQDIEKRGQDRALAGSVFSSILG